MKKSLFLMVIATIVCVSCKDTTEVRSAMGTYSYKSTGTIKIDTLSPIDLSEQGAMDIVSLKNKDSVLVTFNELFGDVYATYACIKGKNITLNPFTRKIDPSTILLAQRTIQVSGEGKVYDGTITLHLEYHQLPTDTIPVSAEVLLIAKKNQK